MPAGKMISSHNLVHATSYKFKLSYWLLFQIEFISILERPSLTQSDTQHCATTQLSIAAEPIQATSWASNLIGRL